MCDCFVNWHCNFFPCPVYPHSHHNLGLIMPSCFCNLNIYQAPHQHPQSSTLHLHTDVEANRAERFGINTVCHQHLLTQSGNQHGPFGHCSCNRSASFKLAMRGHDIHGTTKQTHAQNVHEILPVVFRGKLRQYSFFVRW